jgi:hypothetical protein
MRRTLLLACGSLALAVVVACATSDHQGAALGPVNDGGVSSVPEAESPSEADGAVKEGGIRPRPSCNAVGWCTTTLPDPDLVLRDIWPFEERAFAIAESESLGTKVLEWTESTKSWAYVDDDSQNAYGSGHYAGKIWAPSENEVYYATAPALIYHGARANPSSPFSWESSRLEYDGPDHGPERDPGYAWQSRDTYAIQNGLPYFRQHVAAIGVWGTSADDVYAWYANRIFRRMRVDGGSPAWVAEHVEENPSAPRESFYIFGAAGSSRDEVWFVSSHGSYHPQSGFYGCSALLRRTPDGYGRVMDSCGSEGSLRVTQGSSGTYWTELGWPTSVDSPRPGTAVVVVSNRAFVYVDMNGAGTARFNPVTGADPPVVVGRIKPNLQSVWINGDRAWFSGWGLVIDGENKPDAWAQSYGLQPPNAAPDGGATFSISSTALDGAPLDKPLYQVRGTSNDNLWAVGSGYALHKKTP